MLQQREEQDICPEKHDSRPEKRKFAASISVRIGTQRIKIELCPADIHGGPQGFYRARAARRWIDGKDGEMLFFDRERLAVLLAQMAFDGLAAAAGPWSPLGAAPDIPRNSRVSVKFSHKGTSTVEGMRTSTPPIRAYDGHYYVGVYTYMAGFLFVPVKDVTLHEEPGRGGTGGTA
jgi:hypothetical protein